MRKFFLAVILLLGILFIIGRYSEVQNITATLQAGNLWYFLLALFLEGLWLLIVSLTWQRIYSSVGVEFSRWHLFQIVNSANFANTVAPTGGVSIVAIYLDDAKKRGISGARIAVAYAMNLLFDFTGLLFILIFGLAVMARRDVLKWPEVTASFILLSASVGLAAILYLAMHSSDRLAHILAAFARSINRVLRPFIHREYLEIDRARTFAAEAADGVEILRHNRKRLIPILLLAVINKLLLLVILLTCFWAFQVPYSAGIIVAGFSIGYLFVIVSPTPNGIGLMEGALTLTLGTLGVAVEAAAVITMAFRGITFWIPLLIGLITIRYLRLTENREAAPLPPENS
ncbi:MAG: YbhN family protein [Anaerolineaceae bacterium]